MYFRHIKVQERSDFRSQRLAKCDRKAGKRKGGVVCGKATSAGGVSVKGQAQATGPPGAASGESNQRNAGGGTKRAQRRMARTNRQKSGQNGDTSFGPVLSQCRRGPGGRRPASSLAAKPKKNHIDANNPKRCGISKGGRVGYKSN